MAKVLIVEDDPLAKAMLVDTLEEAGHEVLEAHDWISAIGQLKDGDVSVVVLDVNLPGVSGAKLAETLQRLETRQPKVLLHSAVEEAELEELQANVGAHGYVPKGSDDEVLLAAVAGAHEAWGQAG